MLSVVLANLKRVFPKSIVSPLPPLQDPLEVSCCFTPPCSRCGGRWMLHPVSYSAHHCLGHQSASAGYESGHGGVAACKAEGGEHKGSLERGKALLLVTCHTASTDLQCPVPHLQCPVPPRAVPETERGGKVASWHRCPPRRLAGVSGGSALSSRARPPVCLCAVAQHTAGENKKHA